MKIICVIIISLLVVSPALAENFLGIELPKGKVIEKTDSHIKMEVPMGHDEIVKFYESLLKKEIDIKFRDWKEMTYIEDDGARPWHSINIYKGQGANTTIVINKDRWSWIIGTLILRFIGVFVVLIILMFALSFAGQVMKRLFKAEEKA